MLRFALAGIPVTIDWWFWLIIFILGPNLTVATPEDWMQVAIWMTVVFVSIMIHELGHAMVGRRFGAQPSIHLHGFGGSTYLPGARFRRTQSILVSAAGPLAGFVTGLAVLLLDSIVGNQPRWMRIAVRDALWVNFAWTLVNLLPIQPLDGGQILREVLGPRRAQITAWIGLVLAGVLCLWTFSAGLYFSSFMLAVLAYLNFRQEPMEGGVIKQ
ncbi:MAG: hypothetical protein HY735_30545 [Verrucomicrobia bacterium]|nr:hypothetical protein [Verrucomicrobiota bacterium]